MTNGTKTSDALTPSSTTVWCVRCTAELKISVSQRTPERCLKELGGCGRPTKGEDATTLIDLGSDPKAARGKRGRAEDWFHVVLPQLYTEDGERRSVSDVLKSLDLGGEVRSRKRFTKDRLDELGREFTHPSVPGAVVNGREDACAALREHLVFSQPWHYDILQMWAAQPYLKDVLPDECCANLAFSGGKSSGKTKATKIAAMLAGGEMLGGGTLSAIIRVFDEGKVVGIDELDANLKRIEDLEGIMRAGNTWNAIYKTSTPTKGREWKPRDLHIGGPKVFNFRKDIEDALKSRTYVIEMPRQNDPRLIINNLFLANPTKRITEWLERICGEAVKKWTKAKVEDHMKDPAFMGRLGKLPAALARNRETAAIFLMIADILGWDMDDVMREAVKVQADEETSNEDVREHLAAIYKERASPGTDLEIPQSEVLSMLNQRLKDGGASYRLGSKAFAGVRREFGFQEGVNVKKLCREGGKRYLIFDAPVRKALGVDPGNQQVLGGTPDLFVDIDKLKKIAEHIENKLRSDRGRPDLWIAMDAISAFQLPPDAEAELTGYTVAMRGRMAE